MKRRLRSAMILLRLTSESVGFALWSIRANKLRTFLSLFGITIGIFAIISVFTVVDSLERNVRNSLNSLGSNSIYIQKWPWGMGAEVYPWWKYMNRPVPSLRDLDEVRARSLLMEAACLEVAVYRQVEFQSNSARIMLTGVSSDYDRIRTFDIERGRFFTPLELGSARSIAVLGNKIADELFGRTEPVGRTIKIGGHKFTVMGIFSKEGTSVVANESLDEQVVVPVGAFSQLVNLRWASPSIIVQGRPDIPLPELVDELRGIMRSFHRIHPADDDDFSLNQVSMLQSSLDSIFTTIALAGGIIAFFSILVGGFGIANIMFVSVKERTGQIGIQKALGAKRHIILTQFLFESVLLSVLGGIIGLIVIFLLTVLLGHALDDFEITLSAGNIVRGLLISITIGVASGLLPAQRASRLSPLAAINSTP
ncbi:MAG: ABC transporter permease [Bacteroidales bacterium]|nr:ABC transporter permease [Bacteroidales bacterium]